MRNITGKLFVSAALCFLLTSCTASGSSNNVNNTSSTLSSESLVDEQTDVQTNTDVSSESIKDITDTGPVKGGTLRLFSTKPDTFNPIFTKNSYVQDFLGLIYESLTELNDKQEAVPALSDKWTVSDDGLVWNFHIRTGVNWQDGTALSSADVEFTVKSIMNSKTDSRYKVIFQNIVTYAAVDQENFKIVLNKPNSFLAELMCFPIIPKHQFEGSTADDGGLGFIPTGTGPYRFENYEKDKNVTLAADRNWWYLNTTEKPEQFLYIDNISIRLYEFASDAMSAFQTNDIDVSGIDTADIGKYYGRTDIMIRKFTSRNFEFLSFNLNGKLTGDVSVRSAINASIDRKSIINGILNGCAVESDIPVNPDNWLFENIQSTVSAADTVKSTPDAILKAGGWKKGEQFYYKAVNNIRKDLKLEILTSNSNPQRIKIADKICEQLNNNGISAVVVQLDWDQLVQRIDTKKYDIAVMGLRTNRIPDISFMYSSNMGTSSKVINNDSARNIAGYNNSSINDYLQKLLSVSNSKYRKTYFKSAKQILDTELPYIGLCFLDDAVIYKKNVRGFFQPNCWNKYNDITQWYLPD